MLPLGPRLAVKRHTGERTLPWGLVLPAPEMRDMREGVVIARGGPHRRGRARLPLDVEIGQRVLYSSRVDTFELEGEEVEIDIVEENSVIGTV